MGLRRIAGLILNILTGGTWGLAKWGWSKLWGAGTRDTFAKKVAVVAVANLVVSVIVGKIGIWKLLHSLSYILAMILAMLGWKLEPPKDDQETAQTVMARLKEEADKKLDEMRSRHEAEITELKRAADAKTLSEGIEKLQKQSEEEARRKRIELSCLRAQIAGKAKAEALAAVRAASKAQYSFSNMGFFGPSDEAKQREKNRERDELHTQEVPLARELAKVGHITHDWADPDLCKDYLQKNPSFREKIFLDRIGPVEAWNAFVRTIPNQYRNDYKMPHGFYFVTVDGWSTSRSDPGFIEPYQATDP